MDIDCSFKKLDEGRKEEKVDKGRKEEKVGEGGEAKMDSSHVGIEVEKRSETGENSVALPILEWVTCGSGSGADCGEIEMKIGVSDEAEEETNSSRWEEMENLRGNLRGNNS